MWILEVFCWVYTFLFISKIHPYTEIRDRNLSPSKVVTFLYVGKCLWISSICRSGTIFCDERIRTAVLAVVFTLQPTRLPKLLCIMEVVSVVGLRIEIQSDSTFLSVFLSSSGKLLKIQKLFIILTILKEFFFRGQNLNAKIYRQVEGATCQHLGVVITYLYSCTYHFNKEAHFTYIYIYDIKKSWPRFVCAQALAECFVWILNGEMTPLKWYFCRQHLLEILD